MRKGASLVILVACLCLAAFSASAEKRVALVIGNNNYSSLAADEQLMKAVNDANSVGDALEGLGFEVIRGENLSRGAMLSDLFVAASKLSEGDTAFFFYAGHGVSIDGANYLLPADIPQAEAGGEGLIKFSAIPEATVVETFKARGVRVAVLVLDACRNNPFSQGGTRSFGDATRGLSRPPAVQTQGVFGLYSAGFGEQALDRLGDDDPNPNSVFTRILVPALKTPGESLLDIAYSVNEQVAELAGNVGHQQNPAYYDQARAREIYLAAREPDPQPAYQTQQTTAPDTSRNDSANSCAGAQLHFEAAREINRVEALQDHIDRFGSCEFASLAKLLIENMEKSQKQTASVETTPDVPSDSGNTITTTTQSGVDECRQRLNASDSDHASTVTSCRVAVEQDPQNADANYLLGRALEADEQLEAAVESYRKAAELGNADAQNTLGLKYDYGTGVTLDDAQAVKWYRMAADQGLPAGQFNLGLMYDFGEGVPEDDAEAAKWVRLSADQGFANAQSKLGDLYSAGAGVSQDYAEALKWYQLASDQGYSQAQNGLALAYDYGRGVTEDNAEAARLYRLAADQGYADAQYNLALLYDNGEGVDASDEEAVKWYRAAADQGHAASENMLALHYDSGEGIALDDVEAVKWYRAAAEQNYPSAQYNLALMYENGEGVTSDQQEICKWFRSASELGHAEATYRVGRMQADGNCGFGRDATEAGRSLLKALGLQSTLARSELVDSRGTNLSREVRREVQRALSDQGDYTGAIDGVFGSGTVSALERYANGG